MTSFILSASARFLGPLLIVFSIFLLLRGHQAPGGGFVGGLVASTAFLLHTFAGDFRMSEKIIYRRGMLLLSTGIVLMAVSLTLSLFADKAWGAALWASKSPAFGTPVVFDIGVYLAVVGSIIVIFSALTREES